MSYPEMTEAEIYADLSDWEVVTAQTPYTVRLAVPGGWLYYAGLAGFDLKYWAAEGAQKGQLVPPQMCFVPQAVNSHDALMAQVEELKQKLEFAEFEWNRATVSWQEAEKRLASVTAPWCQP